MFYIFVALYFALVSLAEDCNKIRCSNVVDYVCGLVVPWQGVHLTEIYKNSCYLQKVKCRHRLKFDIRQVPNLLCNIHKSEHMHSGRRVYDFGIVGAHQPCNHTCPTYCADTYDPACASIWNADMTGYFRKPMINHCHIDLFSCAMGVNVTIHPLSECFINASSLTFMTQVAALKSLKLIDDTSSSKIGNMRSLPSLVNGWPSG